MILVFYLEVLKLSKPEWSADGSDIPVIDPHTKAKHQIIEKYIENLIVTLYAKVRRGETTFTFIDGFCGGGMYENSDNDTEWEGSPIKIIQAVRRGYKNSRREYSLNVKFIFLDSNQDHLDCLKNYAMPKAGLGQLVDEKPHEFKGEFGCLVEQCEFRCGKFEDLVNEYVFKVSIRKGHSFFLLDPCGWDDVSMESIRKINSLRGSEIVYTYMIQQLKRFIVGKHGKDKEKFNKILEANGYYESVNLNYLEKTHQQLHLRNESLRLFRYKGNAKYVFTFSLIPRKETEVLYYLIHFSQNLTALEVIKESFWQENNLDYQYYFEIYGYVFRSAEFYEEGQLSFKFDINQDNHDFCVKRLDNDLGRLIRKNNEGIQFRKLCEQTMQLNPASRQHYTSYIKNLMKDKEIEIWRKGKLVTKSNLDLQKTDIIKLTNYKQIWLF